MEDTTEVDMVITSEYVNKLNTRNSADAIIMLIKQEFKL